LDGKPSHRSLSRILFDHFMNLSTVHAVKVLLVADYWNLNGVNPLKIVEPEPHVEQLDPGDLALWLVANRRGAQQMRSVGASEKFLRQITAASTNKSILKDARTLGDVARAIKEALVNQTPE
jgi:hypothetical protein